MPAASHRECQHTHPHATIESEVSKILTDSKMRTQKRDESLQGRPRHRCGKQTVQELKHFEIRSSGLQENLCVVNRESSHRDAGRKGELTTAKTPSALSHKKNKIPRIDLEVRQRAEVEMGNQTHSHFKKNKGPTVLLPTNTTLSLQMKRKSNRNQEKNRQPNQSAM